MRFFGQTASPGNQIAVIDNDLVDNENYNNNYENKSDKNNYRLYLVQLMFGPELN